jgi:phenylacetate-CoA ligase
MQSIQGRDTDVVVTPRGNRLIVHFFTGVLEHFSEIETFQVSQEKADSISLLIVPTVDYNKDTAVKIITRLQEQGASDLQIDIRLVDRVPSSPSGKRRFVVSKIAKPNFAQDHPIFRMARRVDPNTFRMGEDRAGSPN